MPEVPPCDLLLVAGDICPDQYRDSLAAYRPDLQRAWFDRMIRPWVAGAPATHRILTWGNHDWCGQLCEFTEDSPRRASSRTMQIVVDEVAVVRVGERDVRVFASPWSLAFGDWAFMKTPGELAAHYGQIPDGIDILVSHQPPFGYGDVVHDVEGRSEHAGSRDLLAAIERVRPRLVVCGHIHGGHGRYTHQGIPIYNVSVVNEYYRHVHAVTEIELDLSVSLRPGPDVSAAR